MSAYTENVELLIAYAKEHLLLSDEDEVYVRNKLLHLLGLSAPAKSVCTADMSKTLSPEAILKPLLEYAQKQGIEDDPLRFETTLIDAVCPPPSVVISYFDQLASRDIKSACAFLYNFCLRSNYIRQSEIANNVKWKAECEKGVLEITINTSKPEKNNREIAKQKKQKANSYPKCALCHENVGCYNPPYRQTLRVIPISLCEENWFFQFSPYRYYDEHCIVFSGEHIPMQQSNDTVRRLLDFVELFPHYFIGSNAALPIIGGSILTHDHFQGGAYQMPYFKAEARLRCTSPDFPNARITIPDWYNTSIRIESASRRTVTEICDMITDAWSKYNNEKLGIICKTDEQHSAVTTIARLNQDDEYCLELFLRNNRTDEKHPDGIFHVSPDLFNIKSEGIGLIEAMGVFILPGRLSAEAELIGKILTGESPLSLAEIAENESHPLNKHLGLIAQLTNDFGTKLSPAVAGKKIETYINKACERILKCTAVFKDTKEGEAAFKNFLKSLSITPSQL